MIVFYCLIALVVILLLIALLLPNSYTITKSIEVNASQEICYDKIANLNHYKDWNPFAKMEPNAPSIISGPPHTIGHQYTWDGKKIGTGGLTIIKLAPNSSIELELEFLKPFKSKAIDTWKFDELNNNKTNITWSNSGELKYPVARLMGPMIRKNLDQQFTKGLENIKFLCENRN